MAKHNLIETDKKNLIIEAKEKNNGTKYTFTFNPIATIDWTGFKKSKLVNIKTDEREEYKKIIVMRNPKNNKEIFMFPSTYENVFEANDLYEMKNWLFEDDVDVKTHESAKMITTMADKVDALSQAVNKTLELLVDKEADRGLRLEQQKKREKLIKEISSILSTIKNVDTKKWKAQTTDMINKGHISVNHQNIPTNQPVVTMADMEYNNPYHGNNNNYQGYQNHGNPTYSINPEGNITPIQYGAYTTQVNPSMSTSTTTGYVKNW